MIGLRIIGQQFIIIVGALQMTSLKVEGNGLFAIFIGHILLSHF